MQDKQNQAGSQGNPFEIITPSKSKRSSRGIIITLVVVVFLALGIFAGVLLVRQRQEIREKAALTMCPAAEQCPNSASPGLLQSCDPPDTDGTTQDSNCNANQRGRVEPCGGRSYCCNGTRWVTDMSSCATSPSPTSTATQRATATATATGTSAATATATSTAVGGLTKTPTPTPTKTSTATSGATSAPTAVPIPETGTEWPTYLGAGLGILVIVGSLLLAL